MKRLFSFMMVLALVLSLGVTAFAADSGSITITNATVGKDYSVFKIFSATYQGDFTTYSILPTDPFFEDLFGTENEYFEYHESTHVVTRRDNTEDDDLINYLTDLVNGKTATKGPITAGSATVEFTGLDYGYYVITSTLGAAVTIDEVKPTATVIDKNQKTTDLDKMIWDKDVVNENGTTGNWVEASSANVGDTVNFKVKFTATNYDGETKIEKYTITDSLSSAWAAIDTTSIVVKIGTTTLKAGNYTVEPTDYSGDIVTGFKLNIPWVNNDAAKSFKYASPVDVVVTYSATVLEAAASKDPTDNKNTVTSDWDKEGDSTTTKVYNMGFTKVDGTDSSKTLPGAVFALYGSYDEETKVCSNPIKVSLVSEGLYIVNPESATNTVTTPADGQVVIMGLEAGTYYLKETQAPAGYNLLSTTQEVTVGTVSDYMVIGEITYVVNNDELTIANNSGVELPSTGGEGTVMLLTIGTIVALAFAVLLITHKKMSVYQD